MSALSDQYATARRDALSRMRASRGRLRKEEGKNRADLAELAWPFLEISDEELDLASRVPTPSHLRGLAEELRAIRAEKYKILQEPISPDAARKEPNSKRRDLLAEIASEYFRSGMQSWLTSIAPDHGLSATSIVELEQIQSEMQYRLKLVRVMAAMMEREIETLDCQIEGKRALEKAAPAK
jgi:hypothetical protein